MEFYSAIKEIADVHNMTVIKPSERNPIPQCIMCDFMYIKVMGDREGEPSRGMWNSEAWWKCLCLDHSGGFMHIYKCSITRSVQLKDALNWVFK